jgi:ribosome-associated protein
MKKRLEAIINILDSKKAENIETIDLKDTSYLADSVIIATTLNTKHAAALLFYVKKNLKGKENFLNIEEGDDWSILDCGDIFIHLMSADKRREYNLEDFLSKLQEPVE